MTPTTNSSHDGGSSNSQHSWQFFSSHFRPSTQQQQWWCWTYKEGEKINREREREVDLKRKMKNKTIILWIFFLVLQMTLVLTTGIRRKGWHLLDPPCFPYHQRQHKEPRTNSDSGALNPDATTISLFSSLCSSLQKAYFRIQMIFFYELCLITILCIYL